MKRIMHEYLNRSSYLIIKDGKVTKFRDYPKDFTNTLLTLIDIDSISGLITIETDKGTIIIGKNTELNELEVITNGIINGTN